MAAGEEETTGEQEWKQPMQAYPTTVKAAMNATQYKNPQLP